MKRDAEYRPQARCFSSPRQLPVRRALYADILTLRKITVLLYTFFGFCQPCFEKKKEATGIGDVLSGEITNQISLLDTQ